MSSVSTISTASRESLSDESLLDTVAKDTQQQRTDYFQAFDGEPRLREKLNAVDYWLDNRCAVQNGARSIIAYQKKRYVRTIRILKDSDSHMKLLRYAREMYSAQNELSKLTPFVQAVAAFTVTNRSLVVLTPLPYNMYLSDLKRLIVHFSHASIRYYSACIVYALDFLRHRRVQHGNLCLTSIALDQYGRPVITEFDPLFNSRMTGRASDELTHKVEVLRYATLLGVLFCDNMRHFSRAHMNNVRDAEKKDVFNNICFKCRFTAECVEPTECDCHNFKLLLGSILFDIVTMATIDILPKKLTFAWIETELRYSWGARKPSIKLAGFKPAVFKPPRSGKMGSRSKQTMQPPSLAAEEVAARATIAEYEFAVHDDKDLSLKRQSAEINLSVAEEPQPAKFVGASSLDVFQKEKELSISPVSPPSLLPPQPRRSLGSSEVPTAGGVAADNSDTTTTTTPAIAAAAAAADAMPPKDDAMMVAMTRKNDAIVDVTYASLATAAITAAQLPWNSSCSSAIHQDVSRAYSILQPPPPPLPSIYDEDDPEGAHNTRIGGRRTGSAATMQVTKTTQSMEAAPKPKGPFEYNSYKTIMEHAFFKTVKWAELETMPSPENFFYAHGPLVQNYCKETVLTKTADSAGNGERAGRGAAAAGNLKSRSRILYNLFG